MRQSKSRKLDIRQSESRKLDIHQSGSRKLDTSQSESRYGNRMSDINMKTGSCPARSDAVKRTSHQSFVTTARNLETLEFV